MTKLREWHDGQADTAAQVAADIGVHRVTYHKYLSGELMPRPETALRIAKRTGVSAAQLTTDYRGKAAR